jgi:sRNA-binding carbon storage regulator CsrA
MERKRTTPLGTRSAVDSFAAKSRGSQGSNSPERIKRLMTDLTHGKVKIKNNTAVLINAKEVLTIKGISGAIHDVGIGFGTGRHTSTRRAEVYQEVAQSVISKKSAPKSKRSDLMYLPDAMRVDREIDAVVSVRSQNISAMPIDVQDQQNSPRTASMGPDLVSIGLTAKNLSVTS